MKRFAIFVMALAMSALPAHAESVRSALSAMGMVGEWAVVCGAPASGDNSHGTISVSDDGTGQLLYDYGPGTAHRVYTINFAKRLGRDRIRLEAFDQGDHTNNEFVMRKTRTTIQTISNVQGDGSVFIKNGIMLLNGKPAIILNRCNSAEGPRLQ
jgi:hypothetical protein